MKRKTRIGRIALGMMLGLLLSLTACGKSTADRWQKRYDLGQKFLDELDYEQAIIAFTDAIEVDPNQADAYAGRAEAYSGQNDYAAAIADYTTALELDPYNADWYMARGDAYMATGDTGQAQADYERARTMDPSGQGAGPAAGSPEAHVEELVAEGKLDEAMQYIEDNGLQDSEAAYYAEALKRVTETVPSIFSEGDLYSALQMMDDDSDVFEPFYGTEWIRYPISYIYPDTDLLMQIFENDGIFIYYGEHYDGIPDGKGILISASMQDSALSFYLARGDWWDGLPNGDFITMSMDLSGEDGELILTAESGQAVDGLWDGEIEAEMYVPTSGFAMEVYPQADRGYWIALAPPDENGRAPVAVSADGGYTMMAYTDVTCGILGYADMM